MARSFPGGTVSDAVLTGYTGVETLKSYHWWMYPLGASNNDRILDKNSSVMIYQQTDSPVGLVFQKTWQGATGQWRVSSPSTNAWHAIGISYDGGSISNDPLMYVDGVSQSVTEQATPAGSANNDATQYQIGNRTTNLNRAFNGRLAEFAYWDVLLTANEFAALARGVPAYRVRPANLKFYYPLWGLHSPEIDLSSGSLAGTVTGTSKSNHAPISLFTQKWGSPVLEVSGSSEATTQSRGTQRGCGTASGAKARTSSGVGTSRGVGICSSRKSLSSSGIGTHRGISSAQGAKALSRPVSGTQNGRAQGAGNRASSTICVGKQRGLGMALARKATSGSAIDGQRGCGISSTRKAVTISSIGIQKGKAVAISAKHRTTSTIGTQRGSAVGDGEAFIAGQSLAYGYQRGCSSASSRKTINRTVFGSMRGCGISSGRKTIVTSASSPQRGKSVSVSVKRNSTSAFGWQNGKAIATGSRSGTSVIGTHRGSCQAMSSKAISRPALGVQGGVGTSVSLKVILTMAFGTHRGIGRAVSASSQTVDVIEDLIADCFFEDDVATSTPFQDDIADSVLFDN